MTKTLAALGLALMLTGCTSLKNVNHISKLKFTPEVSCETSKEDIDLLKEHIAEVKRGREIEGLAITIGEILASTTLPAAIGLAPVKSIAEKDLIDLQLAEKKIKAIEDTCNGEG